MADDKISKEKSDHSMTTLPKFPKKFQLISPPSENWIKETITLPSIKSETLKKLATILENAAHQPEKGKFSSENAVPYKKSNTFVETYCLTSPLTLQFIHLKTVEERREYEDWRVDNPSTLFPKSIFYVYRKRNGFLFKDAEPVNILQPNTDYSLLVIVDTEYVSPEFENLENDAEDSFIEPRRHVTTQFRSLYGRSSRILVHRELLEGRLKETSHGEDFYSVVRHPVIRPYHPAHIIPFLRLEGYDASLRREDKAHEKKDKRSYVRPFVDLKLYAHMLLVDMTQIFEGNFLEDLKNAFLRKRIIQKRRLSTSGWHQSINMPWILTLNGMEFRVKLSLVDTLGLHGNASYKEICKNTGVLLNVKGDLDTWKSDMDKAYFDIPGLFDQYATEDLKIDDVLYNYDRDIRKIYRDLGIENWYRPPKLTIGSTVNDLFEAKLCQFIGLSPDMPKKQKKEYLEKFTRQSSADYLKTLIQSNAYLLGKCDGGRCRNAHPTRSSLKGILVDIDISSAYTTAMSSLFYPLGNPVILSFKKVLLKDFLKVHRRNLEDGLYVMRIQTRDLLSYEQSLIPSWFHDGKRINRGRVHKNDGESYHITGEIDLDSGETKIFSREIIQGTLTSDLLDVIENVWSPRQRKDFFNKTEILTIAFYPKSLQITTVREVIQALNNFQGRSDFTTTLKGAEIINAQDCHVWTTFPMGERFIDLFKVYRNQHPPGTSLNILYKLFANTTYGDAVSKYFETSNMIFGSNITARCRVMMYLMEIGLNLQGSITDGHVFDINRVLYKKGDKYLNSDHFVRLYTMNNRQLQNKNIAHIRPLFEKRVEKQEGGFIINDHFHTFEKAKEKVDRRAEQHLFSLFSKVGIIGKTFRKLKNKSVTPDYMEEQSLFRLEMKDFVSVASFQGTANYQFVFFDDDPEKMDKKIKTKMRSYESKKKCCAFTYENDDIAPTLIQDFYTKDETPDVHLLREIRKNPKSVYFLPPFIKPFIIKTGDYKNRYKSLWKDSWLLPGDSSVKVQTIRYFSTTQYTYQTLQQYLRWKRVEVKMIEKLGYSLELPYTRDNALDYDEMIMDLDAQIREGVMRPLSTNFKHKESGTGEASATFRNYRSLEKMRAHLIKKTKSDVYESFEDYDDSGDDV